MGIQLSVVVGVWKRDWKKGLMKYQTIYYRMGRQVLRNYPTALE